MASRSNATIASSVDILTNRAELCAASILEHNCGGAIGNISKQVCVTTDTLKIPGTLNQHVRLEGFLVIVT
jgi:hypothetical protein